MDLFILLDYVSSLNEQQKEQVLNEEFNRHKKQVDSLCEIKRRERQE